MRHKISLNDKCTSRQADNVNADIMHKEQFVSVVLMVYFSSPAIEGIPNREFYISPWGTPTAACWQLSSRLCLSLSTFSNLAKWLCSLLASVTHIKIQQCVDLALQGRHSFQQLLYRHGPHHSISSATEEEIENVRIKRRLSDRQTDRLRCCLPVCQHIEHLCTCRISIM